MATVQPDDFYSDENRTIYTAAKRIIERGGIAGPIDLKRVLEPALESGMVGSEYLFDISGGNIPSIKGATYYAERVAKLSKRRKFLRLLDDARPRAWDEESDDFVSTTHAELLALDIQGRKGRGWKKLSDLMYENIDTMERTKAAREAGKALDLVTTGYPRLDKTIMMAPGDIIVVAALTGFGKTSFAVNIGEHVSNERLVAMFSLEMNDNQLARRITTTHTGIEVHRQLHGVIRDHEWDTLIGLAGQTDAQKFHIYEKQQVTLPQILAACRQLEGETRESMGLVIVDYLTLVESHGKQGSETEKAAAISRGLKLLAGELRCPVIALAQFNRNPNHRGGKPELHDLKQSGSIEQDASVVLLLHREGVVTKDASGKEIKEKPKSGPATVIVAKNRYGSIGEIEFHFNAERTQFTEEEETHYGDVQYEEYIP